MLQVKNQIIDDLKNIKLTPENKCTNMKIIFEILHQRVRIADTRMSERVTFSVTDWGRFGVTKSYWTASAKYNKKRIEEILCG